MAEKSDEVRSYLDADGNPFLESGDFEIMTGPNSRDVTTAKLTVE